MSTKRVTSFTFLRVILAAILCLTASQSVSCGRTHKSSSMDASAVGAGSKPAHQSAVNAARAGLEPAPTMPLADALAQIDAYQPPKGVDAARFAALKAELRKDLVLRSSAKVVSFAPTGVANRVTDLAAYADPTGSFATLTWTEVLSGDYDDDGTVDVGDILPVVLNYGVTEQASPDDFPSWLDGNHDGKIDINDIAPIAGNYGAHIDGYQVWRGHLNGSSVVWEEAFRPNNDHPSDARLSVNRQSYDPYGTRVGYGYADDISALSDKSNVCYKVVPYGGGETGTESVIVTMRPPGTGGLADSPWPKFRGDIRNTGQSRFVGAQVGTLKWVYQTGAPVYGSPVIGLDGTVYVTCDDDMLYALNPSDGSLKWKRLTGCPRSNPAMAVDGTVYAATGGTLGLRPQDGAVIWGGFGPEKMASMSVGLDGRIYGDGYAVRPFHYQSDWRASVTSEIESSPAIWEDGTIYFGDDGGNVQAVNCANGSLKWTFRTGGQVSSSPAIGTDGTIYVGSADHNVYALNPVDGSVKWTKTTGYAVYASPAVADDGTVYIGSGLLDRRIYALNPADGSVKWSFQTASEVTSSAAIGADGTVYFGGGKSIYALNPTDGNIKWQYQTHWGVSSSPAIGADGTVYVGSKDGGVYAFGP